MSMKRVKKMDPNPNALFLQWLAEFRDDAIVKGNKGLIKIYNMCIENLSKFPLPLENGHQCKIIQGFGKTICQRLDDRLNKHKEEEIGNNLDIPVSPVAQVIHPTTKPSRAISSPPAIKSISHSISSRGKEKPNVVKSVDKASAGTVTPEPKDRLQEQEDLEEALRRSVEKMPKKKKENHREDSDFKEALRRSSEESFRPKNKSQEDREFEEALRRSMEEFPNNDEDEDFKLALQLSQQEEAVIDDQEEKDRLLAEKLQQEFNRESQRYVSRPSPPAVRTPFTFDNLDNASNHENVFDDEDDLPDIPGVPLDDHFSAGRGSELRDISNTQNIVVDKKLDKVKKVSRIHELSFNSDDEPDMTAPSVKKTPPKKASSLKSVTASSSRVKTPSKSDISGVVTGSSTKKTPGKEYVPRHRTGAYAVLITLYKERCKDEYKGFVTKAWLQEAAQPLADESFSCTSKSEHYTAWSGVSTLAKHELITRWSNPAKFNITDKGMELAARILRVEDGDQSLTKSFDIKRKRSEDTADGLRKKRLARFDNVHVADLSPVKPTIVETSAADFDLGDTFNMSDVGLGASPSVPDVFKSASKGSDEAPKAFKAATKQSTSGPVLPVTLQLHQLYNEQMSASVAAEDRNVAEFELAGGTFDVVLCVDNTETGGGGAGGRKTLKEETVRHLQRCGVNYDRRNLNIGDFLWIARERVDEVRGQYAQREPRELVLPYIIERKRLDDLWQSVKDGRYQEQKFRLKGCGLKHLYYLIEDFPTKREFWGRAGSSGNLVTPEAIEQAIANTAVQEGFTVKRTDDQKGTIEYLTMMTRVLRRKYQNLSLRSCTQTDIADGLVGNRDTTLLPFKHFNDTSRKNKDLTVGEVWAKMLLRLKGLSVDMAQAIVTQYPTLRDLLDAYSACSTPLEKIKLINDLTYGIENKRKIPKNVAEALMKVWNNETL